MIRTDDLRKTYALDGTAVEALRGVTLVVPAGTFVSIMGASGSGKSTLMNLLGCLDQPTSGRYVLDGRDVSTLDADARAEVRNRKLGFVFQSFNLLARTSARENVALPLVYSGLAEAEQRRRADAALAAVGLEGLGDRTSTQLSGGQQQRVAIARALVTEPRLILADEPTGNLDSHTSLEIVALLRDVHHRRGTTVVLVTHERGIAALSDRVILMRDGLVVADGPPPTVLALEARA